MITKQDIKKLQEHEGHPCVSLFIKTHKTMPERLQDPIQVKDITKEAIKKLLSEYKKEEVSDLIRALESLTDSIDYTKSLEGLAIFVGPHFAQSYNLPFSVTDKIVIDKIFATKDLIKGFSITAPYWVLSLSHKPSRLFKGQGQHLTEIIDDIELRQNMKGFPFELNYDVTSDREKLAVGVGDLDASYVTHQLDQFMHKLDEVLLKKLEKEHLPLIVLGTQKNRADFEKISKLKKDIILQIEGDGTHLSTIKIEELIKAPILKHQMNEDAKIVTFLNEAVGKEHYVTGAKDVWRQAKSGQIRILVVEEDYDVPAYIDENNPNEVIIYDKNNVPGGYKNLIDDIVNIVFHSKGKVYFVKSGDLSKFERIAAILWH